MKDRELIRDRTLVLRILVPGLETRLRDKMAETEKSAAAAGGSTILDLEGVRCEPTRNPTLWNFHADGATYPAVLKNLPCPVELHKTHDHAAYYKCTDVAQILTVYEDDMALEEDKEKDMNAAYPSYAPSGLTPPLRGVVKKHFRKRQAKPPPPRAAVAYVENYLIDLMQQLAKQGNKKSTPSKEGRKNPKQPKSKVPTLTSANKVLEEVEDEVIDYEAWMGTGLEIEANEAPLKHPEVWLDPDTIRELKAKEEEKRQRKKKKKKSLSPTLDAIASSQADEIDNAASQMVRGDAEEEDLDLFQFDDDDDLMKTMQDTIEE